MSSSRYPQRRRTRRRGSTQPAASARDQPDPQVDTDDIPIQAQLPEGQEHSILHSTQGDNTPQDDNAHENIVQPEEEVLQGLTQEQYSYVPTSTTGRDAEAQVFSAADSFHQYRQPSQVLGALPESQLAPGRAELSENQSSLTVSSQGEMLVSPQPGISVLRGSSSRLGALQPVSSAFTPISNQPRRTFSSSLEEFTSQDPRSGPAPQNIQSPIHFSPPPPEGTLNPQPSTADHPLPLSQHGAEEWRYIENILGRGQGQTVFPNPQRAQPPSRVQAPRVVASQMQLHRVPPSQAAQAQIQAPQMQQTQMQPPRMHPQSFSLRQPQTWQEFSRPSHASGTNTASIMHHSSALSSDPSHGFPSAARSGYSPQILHALYSFPTSQSSPGPTVAPEQLRGVRTPTGIRRSAMPTLAPRAGAGHSGVPDPDISDLRGATSAQSRRMSDAEKAQMMRRRQIRNRASAERSRKKRKETLTALREEVDKLEVIAQELLERCREVERQNSALHRQNKELEEQLKSFRE